MHIQRIIHYYTLNAKFVLQEIIAIKTRTANYKLRQLNKTGVGDEVIKNCTLTESEMVLAEAINPGQKYNCTVSIQKKYSLANSDKQKWFEF